MEERPKSAHREVKGKKRLTGLATYNLRGVVEFVIAKCANLGPTLVDA